MCPLGSSASDQRRDAAARRRTRTKGVLALVVAFGASLALAACGSSSSGKASGSSNSTTTSTAATSASGSATAVVATANNGKFGAILVDSSGKTLYTLTSGGKAVACSGACLSVWPPLLLPSGMTSATGASGVTGLGVTAAGGGQQVTHDGLPLYRFSADPAAGDANGDGINSFGGVWHVVKTGAGASSGGAGGSSNASSTTSTTSGSRSGY